MSARDAFDARLPDLPRLPAALPRSGVSAEARLALRQVLGDSERALAGAFHAGVDVSDLVQLRARAVAAVVVHVWRSCVGEATDCSLLAVGGFGRGVLFPHSDVDLLVLGEAAVLGGQARALEAFFTCLWDVGLKPGHAVRTLEDCRSLAVHDVSVYTSLLDARLLTGGPRLADALVAMASGPSLWPAQAFLEAKRAEQRARHARYNDTAYNLEPNLKDGPGGLRTLDLMRWLGRRVADARDFDAMVACGLLDRTESTALERTQATLWRYRYALHLAAGRPEERLLFDYQRRLAGEFGYVDEHSTNLAVEQFMLSATTGPDYLRQDAPSYPPDATHLRRQGLVQLSVRFDENGVVQDVQAYGDQETDALLARAARKAVRSWTFSPEVVGGRPRASTAIVPICFAIAGLTPPDCRIIDPSTHRSVEGLVAIDSAAKLESDVIEQAP